MRKLVPLATLTLIWGFAAYGQTAQPEPGPVPPGWRALFNGKDLDGWSVADAGGKPAFTVEDGAIRTQPGNGLLWYSREKIGNATLRVVYRMSNPKGNSGIFIRIPEAPPDERFAIHHGVEVQIDDRDDDWHVTGVLYSMTKALSHAFKPGGEWNTMDITMQGLRTIVKLNGALVTDYDGVSPVPPRTHDWEPERGPRPEAGYIALQHHDDQAVIWFREISLRTPEVAGAIQVRRGKWMSYVARTPLKIPIGGPPGPRGSPWTRSRPLNQIPARCEQADEGVGRGPGGPPHQRCFQECSWPVRRHGLA